ncbi:MAG: polysaccharide deacetylase family protein, partial [Bacteroidota bacterium]
MKLLLYTAHYSNRLDYIFQQVFVRWLGLSIEWTHQTEMYRNYQGPKLHYGQKSLFSDDFLLAACPLLFQKGIQKNRLFPVMYNKIPAFFATDTPHAVFPFDMLATIFFHISRYEEYQPFEPDTHGRFPASESWAYQNNQLQRPIVDLLILELKKALQQAFPELIFRPTSFQFQPTYDVDMAWSFRHKGWRRAIGGYFNDLRQGQFTYLKHRIRTHLGLQTDPFQTFDQLMGWQRRFPTKAIYFFLLADYGPFDKNNLVDATNFQQLIQTVALDSDVGIHPSYQASEQPQFLPIEKKRLEKVLQKTVTRSRQHYLMLTFPDTYRQLLANGIKEDYSMGYAMETGFRAGTAQSFYWYDLVREESTDLLVHPFQVMDVTLKEYLKLSPLEATQRIDHLITAVQSVNGTFCSLWHNSSFSELDDWGDWERVYLYLLEKANS